MSLARPWRQGCRTGYGPENAFTFSDGMDADATFAMEFSHFEKKADKDY